MLKIVWFIPRPERDLPGAEEMYQIGHVRRGMKQENLRRFRINLGLYPQPRVICERNGSDEPAVFRFSEGYWDTFEEIEECYRSPNGLAALADGMLNAVPRVAAGPLPILYASEEEFPTRARLAFDIFSGKYIDPKPVKLFVFVRLKSGQEQSFDAAYAAVATEVGEVDGLGPHILSRTLDHHVDIGRSSRWPAEGTETYHRIAEYYFPDQERLEKFLSSPAFARVMSLAGTTGDKTTVVAVEPQEVFFTTTGNQVLSKGWLNFYSR